MPNGQSSKRRAFTLVEILCVLAIIAVLSAIIFPVFARVREKAYQTTCQNNLKQIGLVFQQYLQDHDGSYPSKFDFYVTGSFISQFKNRQILWCPTGLQPYPGTWSITLCGDHGLEPFPDPPPPGSGQCGRMDSNYGYNTALLTDNVLGTLGSKETKFQNVESLILMDDWVFDSRGRGSYIADCPKTTAGDLNDNLNDLQYGTFHSEGANFLFADGHVKWMNPDKAAKVQCDSAAHLPLKLPFKRPLR